MWLSHAGPQVHGHHRQSYLRKSHLRSSKYHRLLCFQSGSVFWCCLSGSANTSRQTRLNIIHKNPHAAQFHPYKPTSPFSHTRQNRRGIPPPISALPPRVANTPPSRSLRSGGARRRSAGTPTSSGSPCAPAASLGGSSPPPSTRTAPRSTPVNPPSVLGGRLVACRPPPARPGWATLDVVPAHPRSFGSAAVYHARVRLFSVGLVFSACLLFLWLWNQ